MQNKQAYLSRHFPLLHKLRRMLEQCHMTLFFHLSLLIHYFTVFKAPSLSHESVRVTGTGVIVPGFETRQQSQR